MKKSHEIAIAAYRITASFPWEIYGLTNQIRRSASSIPANIAEGCGRDGKKEFIHFLHIVLGSASELQYHLLLSHDLGFVNSSRYEDLVAKLDEIKKMVVSFVKKLRADG